MTPAMCAQRATPTSSGVGSGEEGDVVVVPYVGLRILGLGLGYP
jgi:hypothetical protein